MGHKPGYFRHPIYDIMTGSLDAFLTLLDPFQQSHRRLRGGL